MRVDRSQSRPTVCLCFQVHQPNRLIPYDFFKIGEHAFYEDDALNAEILARVSERCYLPANAMFRRLFDTHEGFRIAMSISGTVVEQMRHHRPDVLESFRELVATGRVELLAETYYHSLAYLHSGEEFRRQVGLHVDLMEEVFGVRPRVLQNTELIYNNDFAATAEKLDFEGVIAEGVRRVLNGKSPNHVFQAPETRRLKTLLRHSELSNDLGFRLADASWDQWPLTPEKYAQWLGDSGGEVVSLFVDYESIGEHQRRDSGVFDFWEQLPDLIDESGMAWRSPSQVTEDSDETRPYDCRWPTSRTDSERDLSAWTGNVMQQEALQKIHELERQVLAVGDQDLTHVWAKLQTSDHFYWMSTKGGVDGGAHRYFCPYDSSYEAYRFFMNVLADLQLRLRRLGAERR